MSVRKANAVWRSGLKNGSGKVSVESKLFTDSNYSFSKRFEDEPGTNPEELLGAAHAACFSMALAADLEKAGYNVVEIKTEDRVHLEKGENGYSITKIEIDTEADVEGIKFDELKSIAEKTKSGCPVAKAITGVEFDLKIHLK
jgi:osmotically inducible protein OsmC